MMTAETKEAREIPQWRIRSPPGMDYILETLERDFPSLSYMTATSHVCLFKLKLITWN